MAVPKKRMSRARTATRRAHHDILTPPTISSCSNCSAPVRPHHVCKECGTYRGRTVFEVAAVEETVEPAAE